MKRRVDPKAITTTIAAVIACAIMGSAVTKIMIKRVGLRQVPPASMESLKSPAPKVSKVERALTA